MEALSIDAVTAYISSGDGEAMVYAWCAASPLSYAAVISCSSAVRDSDGPGERTPHYLPSYRADSGCMCVIRLERAGVALNSFTMRAPLWLAAWQARLLSRLYRRSRLQLNVTDIDSLLLDELLSRWDGSGVRVTELKVRHRLGASVTAHVRETGHPFTALAGLEQLTVLPTQSEHGALIAAEYLPQLRRLCARGCRVEYLRPLRALQHLQDVDLADTLIRDNELGILATLPSLTRLDVSGCSSLTSVEQLAAAPVLGVLLAAGCERLGRISRLGTVATLRVVDLSDNVFLPHEVGAFLTHPELRLRRGTFLHVRWPRDDPPADLPLASATHLYLSYSVLPNIRWLCGARNVEELHLGHTSVTAADLATLAPHTPSLRVLAVPYCDRLTTDLSFTHALRLLSFLTISRRSLSLEATGLEELERTIRVNVV